MIKLPVKKINKLSSRPYPDNIFVGTKTCSTCKITQDKTNFIKDNTKTDFLSYQCKICKSIKLKQTYKSKAARVVPSKDILYKGTKTCKKCNKTKIKKYFHFKIDTDDFLNDWCKQCRKEEQQNIITKYIQNKKQELGGKCILCDESRPAALQFDHCKDGKTNVICKLQNIKKIDNELKLCQLLCACCHQLKSYNDNLKNKKNRKFVTGKYHM
jgi:hypothetical protein